MNHFKKRAAAVFITVLMSGVAVLAGNPAATQLIFTAQPTNVLIGATLPAVTVQLAAATGTNVAESGVAVVLALNKAGLHGATNLTTDATGKVTFTNLVVSIVSSGDKFTATAAALKSASSSSFSVSKGSTTTTVASSTNFLVYGQGVTFTATTTVVLPAGGAPTGLVTFKDGSTTLGTAALNTSGVAALTTNRISAASTNQNITAVYAGDTNFLTSASSNLVQSVGKLALTVSGIIASNKVYDGATSAGLNFTYATLATVLAGDTVTLNAASATGAFTDKSAGTNKTVLVTGLALGGASAANYSVSSAAANATISPRNLVVTAKGVNKVYDSTVNATVTLSDNRLAGDVFTNACASATFADKDVGAAVGIIVSGIFIGGTNADDYTLSNNTAVASANITAATLTVSNVVAENKTYDGATVATLNLSNAVLVTVFPGDSAALNPAVAKGAFSSKTAGVGKTVTVTGLTLSGTNAGDYALVQPSTTANITARGLTITAKGVNRAYNGATNATVTLSDNHVTGDNVVDSCGSASFASQNVATNIVVTVAGLAISGNDSTNYFLTATNAVTAANITKAGLTVSGVIANNKVYDRTTAATLIFSNAALVTVFAGDTVTLVTNGAKGVFAAKSVGSNITVTVSGLALGGVSSNNYSLTQPVTTANITARGLTITAHGVAKIYDGTTNAAVTLTDNRVSGDLLTNSYAAAWFAAKNPGTNLLINVYGLATTGPDAPNYYLTATNTTAFTNITRAPLTVAAASLSRPYGATNPVLFAVYSGFVPGESLTNSDVSGSPILATSAKTNSNAGVYPITIAKGTLVSSDYAFQLTNGVLTVTRAATAALLTTTLNPAFTNQNVTFAATVQPLSPSVLPAVGVIQFRCNGSNALGSPISLTGGAANFTVIACALGATNSVITAEYSDPEGNFNSSTNSITQTVMATVALPPPSTLSLAPALANGAMTAQLAGVANQQYVIEVSSDLVNWTPLSTNIADASGTVFLVDSNAMAFPSRYYRAYSPAP